jgi:hypothetical protein
MNVLNLGRGTEGFLIAAEVSDQTVRTPADTDTVRAAIQLPSTYPAGRHDRYFIVQDQKVHDCASRSTFCEQFVTLVNEHPDVIRHLTKSL